MEVEFTDSSEMMVRNEDSKDVEPVYKFEVAANWYDLLSLEGLTFALRSFLLWEAYPTITVKTPETPLRVTLDASTLEVRPCVVAAVLWNINFNQERFNSFIELQDLLHNNICRWRTLASIGTHDLDKVQGNIRYEAHPPSDIVFKALK